MTIRKSQAVCQILFVLISVQVLCQQKELLGSRRSVSSGGEERLERLRIVSKIPNSRQRTTTLTRRVVRPPQGVSKSVREAPGQVVVNRPETDVDFAVLKQAKEGVWYRRVEDEDGVALIRVKSDDVILNKDQRTKEELTLKDKEYSDGFWYKRLDDGDGRYRLVRMKNEDQLTKEDPTPKNKERSDGFWYRRVNDGDGGSRLIRVKNNYAILNGEQRTLEDITLKDKEGSDGFWYRRVNDEDGDVRLVRVKNDDIIIKSLKTFKTQTTTRTLRAA